MTVPDRATILAATPKCPRPGPCSQTLKWSEKRAGWTCPVHGPVLAGFALTMRQAA